MFPDRLRLVRLLILLALWAVPWPAFANMEAERARREMLRQQRVAECQNRVLAQQQRYASAAEFLRARQACAAAR